MSETVYPLLPMNDSPYQFLVRRKETFFVDKLALIVNNAPIFEWNVHYLNLKGKHTFDYAGKSIEIRWSWGWSGQPLSFTMYANGTTVAQYVEQKPHAPMEGLSRYVLNSLGLACQPPIASQTPTLFLGLLPRGDWFWAASSWVSSSDGRLSAVNLIFGAFYPSRLSQCLA